MIEIYSLNDIKKLEEQKLAPSKILSLITKELEAIYNWSDEDHETDFESFNAKDYGYGYIAIIEGTETPEEIKAIGLSDGLEGVVPEAAFNYYCDDSNKWTRIVVIYNDSFSMSFFLKNCDLFDSYIAPSEAANTSAGNINPDFIPF